MVKRARLIYNPSSGREEIKKKLPELLQKLDLGGLETSCYGTQGEGDAMLAAEDAVNRGFDYIIAAGGDGTLYEVVNGMANQPNRPALGVLPLGTTNDFARALGIPRNWSEACDVILQHHAEPVDIGRCNDKFFINIAGGGSLTELTYEVPTRLKTVLGQLAYYMKGLEKLPRLRPIDLKLYSDEYIIEEEVMLFLICNSNSVGGFETLAPHASLNDGKFDVLVLKKCNFTDFIRIMTQAARGKEHIHDPLVTYFQTNQLEVRAADYTQLNLDGEFGGKLPCTFSVLPKHIEVLVDKSKKRVRKVLQLGDQQI